MAQQNERAQDDRKCGGIARRLAHIHQAWSELARIPPEMCRGSGGRGRIWQEEDTKVA